MSIHPNLVPHVAACLEEGIEVYRTESPIFPGPARYVTLSLPEGPAKLNLSVSQFPLVDPTVSLTIAVKPSREYGNAVLVDYSGDPAELPDIISDYGTRTSTPSRFGRTQEMLKTTPLQDFTPKSTLKLIPVTAEDLPAQTDD